jgi:indole-3-glycerol phosphate synthase
VSRTAAPDLLEAIVAATRKSVASRKSREPQAALERRAVSRAPAGAAFRAALARRDRVNIIAECKRRSPSRGVLRKEYDPGAIARSYERAGAAAISVLTEPTFFDGALDHLQEVRDAVQCPLLRKDFIVEQYQLLEAMAAGADAVLLIVSALNDVELAGLHGAARALGLAVLVEVHDLDELDRALGSGAEIVGVNNRNLRTLQVDTRVSDVIASRMPDGVIAVSESGLKSDADLARVRALGYHALLIGEHFMTASDPGHALESLIGSGAGLHPGRPQ